MGVDLMELIIGGKHVKDVFIHRNLKSSNILFGEDLTTKVADFGVIHHVPEGEASIQTTFDGTAGFKIIEGIARGLLYLHRDYNMEPKISAFDTARTFDQNQDEGYTNRMMGTFGYMSPEYAAQGFFSIKSDVFSFGVLVIEIRSGRENKAIDHISNLILLGKQAWKLWTENRPAEFIDDTLQNDSTSLSVTLRYMHIGLLCVQQRPEDRPAMSTVVLMLNGENILPEPSQPGFYIAEHPPIQGDSGAGGGAYSLSDTFSSLEGR